MASNNEGFLNDEQIDHRAALQTTWSGKEIDRRMIYSTVNDGVRSMTYEDREVGDHNTSTETAVPRIVYIRVVFMKLGEIDTVKETFSADVFIQARWREPRLDGMDNAANKNVQPSIYWNPRIVIDNALGDPKENISTSVVYDTNNWEAYIVERRRVKGSFMENLELFHFPFDIQDLTVTLTSELDDHEVIFDEDPKQSSTINTEMFVDEQEWRLFNEVEIRKGSVIRFYQLDMLESLPHSFLSCRTHAARRPGFYIYSVFLIMCFICSMTFCTFAVDLIKRENRLQLTFILLLTTVTFKFAVNSSLPRISYLTTLDVYILSSSVILILVCIWHAVVIPIQSNYGTPAATSADVAVLISLGSLYVILHVIMSAWIAVRVRRRTKKYEELERLHKKKLKKEKKVADKVNEPTPLSLYHVLVTS